MRRLKWLTVIVSFATAGCAGLLLLIAALLILALFIIKLMWAWTIPDLFPGAVEQGLVAETLSWFTAFKLALFVALLGGLAGWRRGDRG